MDRCLELNLDYHEPIVGLLPGSQLYEFRRLLPVFIKAFQKIQARFPQAQSLLLLPETISEILVEEIIGDDLNARIVQSDVQNTIHLCDAIITSSPRLTLDVALLETPMVLIRDTAQKSPTLCNLIAEKHIVKEFTRNTDAISQEVISLLNNDVAIKDFKEELKQVKSKLQMKEGQASIGKLVLSLLSPQSLQPQ
jgi:lipid-A-disaccharide synthase